MVVGVFGLGLVLAALVSGLVCAGLVLTSAYHGHLTHDSAAGIQKVHRAPTPRVGGAGLILGAAVGGLALPGEAQAMWWVLTLAAMPAFLSGLIEDVTKKVGVKWRLGATIGSGLIFSALTGYHIAFVGIPGADTLLGWPLFAIPFTAFAIGGIANSINIIDGFHGLAAGCAIIIMAAFGLVAWQVGDAVLLGVAAVTVGMLLGFLAVNFPFGKIFLGDAGAYYIGFLLAVVAVMLPMRNAEVSPLIGLVALAYPVTETMVSVVRRMRREGTNPGQPDRLHLHSLVHRSLARDLARAIGRPGMANPCTSVIVWTLPALSAAFAVWGQSRTMLTLPLVLVVVLVYLRLYRRVALMGTPRSGAAQRR